MREAEPPDRPTLFRSRISLVLLVGVISFAIVALWLRFAPAPERPAQASGPVTLTKKSDEVLTPIQALQKRVDAGDPEAQRLMAIRYRDGDGVLRSAEETLRLLNAAIKGGDIQSLYELACIYDSGEPGIPTQPITAWLLFNEAAINGNLDAMWYVSEVHMRGASGIQFNPIEAYAWRSVALHLGSQSSARISLNWSGPRSRGSSGADETFIAGKSSSRYLSVGVRLSDADILLAQKRSKELLKEVEANMAKKAKK